MSDKSFRNIVMVKIYLGNRYTQKGVLEGLEIYYLKNCCNNNMEGDLLFKLMFYDKF